MTSDYPWAMVGEGYFGTGLPSAGNHGICPLAGRSAGRQEDTGWPYFEGSR